MFVLKCRRVQVHQGFYVSLELLRYLEFYGAVFSDKNRNMEWALGASFVAALSALDIRATAPSPTPSPKPDLNQQKIDELNRRFRVDG